MWSVKLMTKLFYFFSSQSCLFFAPFDPSFIDSTKSCSMGGARTLGSSHDKGPGRLSVSLWSVYFKEFPHWFKNYKTGELSPASMNPASSQHSRSASWGPQKATSPCPTCPRRSPFQTNQTSAWRKSNFRSVLIILSLVNTISARFFTSNTSLHCDTKKPYHICIVTWLT